MKMSLRLALAFLVIAPSAGAVAAPDNNAVGARWWIEVVRERELPTALLERRKAEAEKRAEEEEAAAGEAAAAEAEPPVKARLKALLKALPKAKPKEAAEEEAPAAEEEAPAVGEEAPEEGADEPPAPPAAPEGDAKEAPAEAAEAEPEVETLSITIAMAGEVVGLNSTHLRFRPAVRPDEELQLPLSQVTSLSRHAPGQTPATKDPPDLEFRVVLRDGSEVPGQLMGVSDKSMTVALVGSGAKIDLPLGEITRVERNDPVGAAAIAGALPEVPGRHIAALSTGEVVAGQLLPSRDNDKWLRISSPILTAECPLSLIDLLIFPDPEAAEGDAEEALADEVVEVGDGGNNDVPKPDVPDPEPPVEVEPVTDSEPDLRHLVSLSPAGMLWAKKLEVQGDQLLISALGKEGFSVPMSRVESVSFGHEGLPATAPVLVWGGFSDEDDEYRKTIDALDDRIPNRKLLQNMSKVPDADFMRQLRRARVLLVPEMESFNKNTLKEAMEKDGKGAPSWKEAFRGFLRRGGNIVFLSPTGEALNFFNECGLGPLRSGGSGSRWEFTAEGKKLGAKVDGAVDNVNATHYYRKGEPFEIWGAAQGGANGAVVVGRRLERGWVMVFGADFYETNEEVTETLVKMLEYRGRR